MGLKIISAEEKNMISIISVKQRFFDYACTYKSFQYLWTLACLNFTLDELAKCKCYVKAFHHLLLYCLKLSHHLMRNLHNSYSIIYVISCIAVTLSYKLQLLSFCNLFSADSCYWWKKSMTPAKEDLWILPLYFVILFWKLFFRC